MIQATYTYREAATVFGISMRDLRRHIAAGRIDTIKDRHQEVIPGEEVQRLMTLGRTV